MRTLRFDSKHGRYVFTRLRSTHREAAEVIFQVTVWPLSHEEVRFCESNY